MSTDVMSFSRRMLDSSARKRALGQLIEGDNGSATSQGVSERLLIKRKDNLKSQMKTQNENAKNGPTMMLVVPTNVERQ